MTLYDEDNFFPPWALRTPLQNQKKTTSDINTDTTIATGNTTARGRPKGMRKPNGVLADRMRAGGIDLEVRESFATQTTMIMLAIGQDHLLRTDREARDDLESLTMIDILASDEAGIRGSGHAVREDANREPGRENTGRVAQAGTTRETATSRMVGEACEDTIPEREDHETGLEAGNDMSQGTGHPAGRTGVSNRKPMATPGRRRGLASCKPCKYRPLLWTMNVNAGWRLLSRRRKLHKTPRTGLVSETSSRRIGISLRRRFDSSCMRMYDLYYIASDAAERSGDTSRAMHEIQYGVALSWRCSV
jgi:hypothetical protein